MTEVKTRMGISGRLVIPSEYRRALGIKPGDEIILLLEEDEIRIISARQAVQKAQALVSRYIPRGRCLSEELIRERREEFKRG